MRDRAPRRRRTRHRRFLYVIAHAVRDGHTLPALFGSRTPSLGLLLVGVLATRSSVRMPPGRLPAVAGIGLLDVGANSIVSVLGSEYPVVTVILARSGSASASPGPRPRASRWR